MGQQSHTDRNQSGSQKPAPQASQPRPQNQNRNDNNATESNKPDNRSARQNAGKGGEHGTD